MLELYELTMFYNIILKYIIKKIIIKSLKISEYWDEIEGV